MSEHLIYGSPLKVITPESSGSGVEDILAAYYAIADVHIYELGDEAIEYTTEHVWLAWKWTVKQIGKKYATTDRAIRMLVAARKDFQPHIIDDNGRVKCHVCKEYLTWTSRTGVVETLKDLHGSGENICQPCFRKSVKAWTQLKPEPQKKSVEKPWLLDPQQVGAVRAKAKGYATYEDAAARRCVCKCCGGDIIKGSSRLTFILPTPPGATLGNRFVRWAHMHLACEPAVVPVEKAEVAA